MNLSNFLTSVAVFNETELTNVPLNGLTNLVGKIIEIFSFGGLIAIGILLFSLLLKILPLPLDIYSRISTKKNALKMEKMRPELEKLQRQYANNKELYNQKMMALYKREGYSMMSSCLPTLFTLVFFIIVITAFNKYSTYSNVENFNNMARAYNNTIITSEYVESGAITVERNGEGVLVGVKDNNLMTEEQKIELIKRAQDNAADKYLEESENFNFLWIENIWIADLPWKKAFVNEKDYPTLFTYSKGCSTETVKSSISNVEAYKILTGSSKLDEIKNKPNGYLILVILSIGSMLGSQLIMSKSQKAQMELQSVDGANGQAAQTSKMMMWMMPIMFGIFAFFYSASFSLYLIISTVFSTAFTMVINVIVEKRFNKKVAEEEDKKYKQRFKHLNK